MGLVPYFCTCFASLSHSFRFLLAVILSRFSICRVVAAVAVADSVAVGDRGRGARCEQVAGGCSVCVTFRQPVCLDLNLTIISSVQLIFLIAFGVSCRSFVVFLSALYLLLSAERAPLDFLRALLPAAPSSATVSSSQASTGKSRASGSVPFILVDFIL